MSQISNTVRSEIFFQQVLNCLELLHQFVQSTVVIYTLSELMEKLKAVEDLLKEDLATNGVIDLTHGKYVFVVRRNAFCSCLYILTFFSESDINDGA